MTDESVVETVPAIDVKGLRGRVETLIKSSTPVIVERIVQTFVKQEQERLIGILMDGLKKHSDAEAAFMKLKPDFTVFAEDGVTVKERGWTAPKKSERDKAKNAMDKLAMALNAAIGTGNFEALEKIMKGGAPEKADDAS